MSESTPSVPSGATRSLPPRANLEFERKRAKALLRRLRRENSSAKLADAQFAVARELGFASWPRLVQYFAVIARQAAGTRSVNVSPSESYDGDATSLLAEHRLGREWAGRAFAAYVPRLYGRSIANVLASDVTIDDARLVVARRHSCTSWEQLLAEAAAERERRGDAWQETSSPFMRGVYAITAQDLPGLQRIVNEHPELLQAGPADAPGRSLVVNALIVERHERTAGARAVTDWLVSMGMDLSRPLNEALLGHYGITPAEVEYLLNRGADAHWRPANSVSVLEHAILRYGNGASVDVIARLVDEHPHGLWAAAGLGDVAGVRRCFDRTGKLRPSARDRRPPFDVLGSARAFPMLPDPDDFEIVSEAALVAALNGRAAVIEAFIDVGFPIDYIGWGGTSLLRFAIGNVDVPMVEMLVRRGADLDAKGEWPHASAREFARHMVNRNVDAAKLRRILEICGAGTIEDVTKEADRERPSPPAQTVRYRDALAFASDDARRRDRTTTGADSLFVGLLYVPNLPLAFLVHAGVDVIRLRESLGDRLPSVVPAARGIELLPFDEDAAAIVQRALAIAEQKRQSHVGVPELLAAIAEQGHGFGATLIVGCGGDTPQLLAELAKA